MLFRHKGGVSPPSRLWRTEEATRSPCGEVAAKLCWLLPPGENSRWAFSGLSSADPTPAAGGALRPRTRVLSSCCRPRAFIYNRRFLRAAIRDAHSGTARGSRPRLQRGGPGPSGRPRVAAEAAPVGFLPPSRGLAAPTPPSARPPPARPRRPPGRAGSSRSCGCRFWRKVPKSVFRPQETLRAASLFTSPQWPPALLCRLVTPRCARPDSRVPPPPRLGGRGCPFAGSLRPLSSREPLHHLSCLSVCCYVTRLHGHQAPARSQGRCWAWGTKDD